jgi:UDP-3-O-[3-hydroxymyristoyl] glucosamine N-acyltransferase
MTRVLLCGGGGFGREVLEYLRGDVEAGVLPGLEIGGLLNDTASCELLASCPELPYLGCPQDFVPATGDAVLITLGSVDLRRRMADTLTARGVNLYTYAHRSAWISPSAKLSPGVLVCPNSIVNAGAVLDTNVAVNVFCSIGHGAKVGAHAVLSPYCALSGNSELGESGFMGTRATLFPGVVLGQGCIVDAHSAVKQSAPAGKVISVRGQYLVLDNRMLTRKPPAS